MIDNLFDVLYVAITGKIKPDASLTDNLYGKKFYDAHSGIITTATGNPVSIVTNKAQNAISTILSYSPRQSGSGDPSPSNVRPIEGWTEANLNVAGKNLFDIQNATIKKWRLVSNSFVTISDSNTNITFSVNTDDSLDISTNGTFYGIGFNVEACPVERTFSLTGNPKPYALGLSEGYIDGAATIVTSSTKEIVIPANTGGFLGFFFYQSGTNAHYNCQIEVGTQATAYEPYITPTTITESLGGTYYGFEIDVERGMLRVDQVLIIATKQNVSRLADAVYRIYNVPNMMEFSTNSVYKFSSDKFKTDVLDTGNRGYAYMEPNQRILFRTLNPYESVSDMIDAIGQIEFVYPIATPIELPLTPQTVALLAGANTLWCDGDNIEITYKAKRGV